MAIQQIMAQNGISLWGVCDYAPLAEKLLPCRAASRLPEAPQSVLVALFPYRFPDGAPRNLSRYAAVNDYHPAVTGALERVAEELRAAYPHNTFAVFADNSPIPEVTAAALAGLGVVGDNGLLIHPTFGSYVFIGEIVTDRPLTPAGDEIATCPHCGRCAVACPAGCVGSDKAGCLSALTQQKGELTAEQQGLIRTGGLVWGCDTCQEACPLNKQAKVAPHPIFTDYHPWLTEEMLTAADLRRQAYGWRGGAPLKRNLEILKEAGE